MKRRPFPAQPLQPKENVGRFQKGQSGNPHGRPKATKTAAKTHVPALDIVLNKTLKIVRNGMEREVTAEEALQNQIFRAALAGKRADQTKVCKWISKREAWLEKHTPKAILPAPTVRTSYDPQNADAALLLLGIAAENPARADYDDDRKQLLLEPWAVQAALNRRRGATPLTKKDIDDVTRSTRDARSLKWPSSQRSRGK